MKASVIYVCLVSICYSVAVIHYLCISHIPNPIQLTAWVHTLVAAYGLAFLINDVNSDVRDC